MRHEVRNGAASPVPIPTNVKVSAGPALLAHIDDGPGLAAHRERYGAPPRLDLDTLVDLTEGVRLRGRGGAAFPFATKLRPRPRAGARWWWSTCPRRAGQCQGHRPGTDPTAPDPGRCPQRGVRPRRRRAARRGPRRAAPGGRGDEQGPRRAQRQAGGADALGPAEVRRRPGSGSPRADGRPAQPSRDVLAPGRGERSSRTADVAFERGDLGAGRALVLVGEAGYRRFGTADEPGTTLLTLSGTMTTPRVIEAEYGARMRDLLPRGLWRPVLVGGFHGSWTTSHTIASARVSVDRMAALGSPWGPGSCCLRVRRSARST